MNGSDAQYARTEVNQIPQIVDELRANFYKMTPTSVDYRVQQLKQLLKLLQENKEALMKEYINYFGGFANKHYCTRLWLTECDIIEMINNLDSFVNGKTSYAQPFPVSLMWSAETKPHPKGVVLIIGAWNYPQNLLLRPLVGAIAAGNACVIKPSEVTDGFSRLFCELIPKYMDSKTIKVIAGGIPETTKLLEQKFDFIMFTGASFIGKIVMTAAAKHLTPVCLELGGKNPVIIDDKADLDTSMKRIAFARWWFNSGQVCVCPEYLLVSKDKVDDCVKYLRKWIYKFFIEKNEKGVISGTEHYGRVVNVNHWRRLDKIRQYYIKNEPSKIAIGETNELDKEAFGVSNEKERYMAPMVLAGDIDFENDEIMKSEVFGPFLTIVGMDGNSNEWRAKACEMIRSRGEPLALYIFSPNDEFINYFDARVTAGSVTCNDCIFQMTLKDVPFGGAGESGMGSYGGKHSFNQFSHMKPLNKRSHGLEFLNKDRYPPTDLTAMLGMMDKIKPTLGGSWLKSTVKYAIIVLIAGLLGYYLANRSSA